MKIGFAKWDSFTKIGTENIYYRVLKMCDNSFNWPVTFLFSWQQFLLLLLLILPLAKPIRMESTINKSTELGGPNCLRKMWRYARPPAQNVWLLFLVLARQIMKLSVLHNTHGCMALHKKWSFPLRISSVNETKTADLVTFTEEILNGKLPFFCGGYGYKTLNTKKSKTFRTERSSYKKKASGKCFVQVV